MRDRFGDVRGQRKVGALAYALAALSIIPVIGVVLGAMSITWGVNTRKARGKRLAAFAALGVAVSVGATVVLYRESGAIGLMRWLERHDTFDLIRAGVARSALDRLVPAIEFYKVRYGHYPETLEELAESLPQETDIFIIDPMTVRAGRTPANFFYRRVDPDHYYLRSVGPDGIPFTADDILPSIEILPGSTLGLIKEPPKQI
ncbi:MAG TPA: hypothetical protein VEC75_12980 [Stellaceae bacterium]|nr:hypothetical protein [Stellaceae bacterium]